MDASWLAVACIFVVAVFAAKVKWFGMGPESATMRALRLSAIARNRGRPRSTSSWLIPGFAGTATLLVFRTLGLTYLVASLVHGIADDDAGAGDGRWASMGPASRCAFFFYNTYWSYVSLLAYFAVAWATSAGDVSAELAGGSPRDIAADPRSYFLEPVLLVMCEVSASATLTVAVLFWAVIAKGGGIGSVDFFSATAHGGNVLWALAEMFLNAHEWDWRHALFPLAMTVAWEVVALCIRAATGEWIYDVQDASEYGLAIALLFYPAFVVGHVAFFFVMLAVNWLFRGGVGVVAEIYCRR